MCVCEGVRVWGCVWEREEYGDGKGGVCVGGWVGREVYINILASQTLHRSQQQTIYC